MGKENFFYLHACLVYKASVVLCGNAGGTAAWERLSAKLLFDVTN